MKSFFYAFRGVGIVFREEQNMRIHGFVAVIAIALIFFLELSLIHSVLIILTIGVVFILEMVNTVVERLIDMQKPTVHKYVSDIKDMMAGAVLIATLVAIIVGIIIFGTAVIEKYPFL